MKFLNAILLACLLIVEACSSGRKAAEAEGSQQTKSPVVNASSAERLRQMLLREPGVYFTSSGEIRIRGSAGPPLFVVDGTPIVGGDLSFLNPADVARIEVLKGPDTSIYGSRGGNGVIEITTKRGDGGDNSE